MTHDDIQRVATILRHAASALESCSLNDDVWGNDYIWSLPNDQVFVDERETPEVLVTSVSEELQFLETDIAEQGRALPFMLSKVGDILRACEAAIVVPSD